MRTEQIDPRYVELDSWSAAEMIAAMYEGQLAAAGAVRGALGAIAAAVEDAVPALQRGGRIVYAGAGTSARIGVQDGSELPPTYDWPADRLVFVMAGGLDALVRSTEGAEDNEAAGTEAMTDAKIGADDVVIGVAASGTTPFTIGALRAANAAGAVTIAVANNPDAPLFEVARHRILVDTGSEVIAGSTRMNAGTAQKIVLNLFSTAVMVKMGRVYRGLMVDMRARNAKLRRRAVAIVRQIVGCAEGDATRHLEQADGDLKTAILLGFGLSRGEAAELLNDTAATCAPRSTSSNVATAEPSAASAMARETAEIPAAAGVFWRAPTCSRTSPNGSSGRSRASWCSAAAAAPVMSAFICATFSRCGWACSPPPPLPRSSRPTGGRRIFAMPCSSWCRNPDAVPISSTRRRWRASSAR